MRVLSLQLIYIHNYNTAETTPARIKDTIHTDHPISHSELINPYKFFQMETD